MNFDEILTNLNIPRAPEGHHHARPGWIQIDCPFCGKDSHKYHTGYSIEGRYLNCWQCGYHSIIDVVMAHTGLPYWKVKKLVKDLAPVRIPKEKIKGRLQIPKGVAGLMPAHCHYLRYRKFADINKLLRLWKIGGIGIASVLSWRIFIPIHSNGQVVSWTTRAISDNVLRYKSAGLKQEAIHHKELLYGEDFVRHGIIIVEGPLDVWRIGPGAVSTFGLGYTQAQLLRMSKYPVRAVCFDNEPEAQKRANSLCNELAVLPGDTCNVTLEGKDPGSASKKEINQLRRAFL